VLRFDDRVAVVTGAGGGLGRAHALLLAERGARLVVNDTGGAVDGTGGSSTAAEKVAQEVSRAGGIAIADGHSVATLDGAAALIERGLATFGRVDIVVNNAGTTGRSSMADLNVERLETAFASHLLGSFWTTKAVWQHMLDRGYGRIVNTGSGVGYFGMGGATIYAAAKMGIDGLTRSLAIEGAPHGIKVNCLAPVAQTRMAGTVYGDLADHVPPDLVSNVVGYLAHESCAWNGRVLSAGGGRVAEIVIAVTNGIFDPNLTVEEVASRTAEITARDDLFEPFDALDEVEVTAKLHGMCLERATAPIHRERL